jgi:starch phosphorylase
VHSDGEEQSRRDAESLYSILETQVVPMYYERDADDVPRAWVARMKHAVASLAHRFNADRMVRDYVLSCYLPAAGGVTSLMPGAGRD